MEIKLILLKKYFLNFDINNNNGNEILNSIININYFPNNNYLYFLFLNIYFYFLLF